MFTISNAVAETGSVISPVGACPVNNKGPYPFSKFKSLFAITPVMDASV